MCASWSLVVGLSSSLVQGICIFPWLIRVLYQGASIRPTGAKRCPCYLPSSNRSLVTCIAIVRRSWIHFTHCSPLSWVTHRVRRLNIPIFGTLYGQFWLHGTHKPIQWWKLKPTKRLCLSMGCWINGLFRGTTQSTKLPRLLFGRIRRLAHWPRNIKLGNGINNSTAIMWGVCVTSLRKLLVSCLKNRQNIRFRLHNKLLLISICGLYQHPAFIFIFPHGRTLGYHALLRKPSLTGLLLGSQVCSGHKHTLLERKVSLYWNSMWISLCIPKVNHP